ncbi:hypothetical protein GN244_ATG04795 [Phytophthora infestans]|uniref:Uncharacterized protein n=1 Tax=Phytophthora infestans TaxID=4787 RepID=A0A833WYT9_PHYIN|nr:hypothetical protein GN244_ATG04795 [Phytophthora infestans]
MNDVQVGVGDTWAAYKDTERRVANDDVEGHEGDNIQGGDGMEQHAVEVGLHVGGLGGSDDGCGGWSCDAGVQVSTSGSRRSVESESPGSTRVPFGGDVVHADTVHCADADVTRVAAVASTPRSMGKAYMNSLNVKSGLPIVANPQVA